ncbi:hypothetical protein ACQCU1_12540 [Sutcliffiella horikoshii]|uniref:hypothetical protein n=1 Tax=Sutcliffiella horikoshii TaxID=79883 RepID=UPI003CEB94CB
MNKIEYLKTFFMNYIQHLEPSSSSGKSYVSYPPYDIFPRDFMNFAKHELVNIDSIGENPVHIVNCISNLKRAVDCQLDIFLYHADLLEYTKRKNLKFDKKLNFIRDIGIIESSSLSRLNHLRNKMEHHYVIPRVSEIEVYYDLVLAFISVLESHIVMFLFHYALEIECNSDDFNFFKLDYVFETEPKIKFEIIYCDSQPNTIIEVIASEQEEFAYYFKSLLMLSRLGLVRRDYIIEQLIG